MYIHVILLIWVGGPDFVSSFMFSHPTSEFPDVKKSYQFFSSQQIFMFTSLGKPGGFTF